MVLSMMPQLAQNLSLSARGPLRGWQVPEAREAFLFFLPLSLLVDPPAKEHV